MAGSQTKETDMPRIRAGDIILNYVEHGSGDNVVLAIHGNLGCANTPPIAIVLPVEVRRQT